MKLSHRTDEFVAQQSCLAGAGGSLDLQCQGIPLANFQSVRDRRHSFAGLGQVLSSKVLPSWLRDVYRAGDDTRDSCLSPGAIVVVLQKFGRPAKGAEGPRDVPPSAVGAIVVVVLQRRIFAM